MENTVDNYLHKKFKKQLSIDPKPQQYDKENKNSARILEQSEEKNECNTKLTDNQTRDNNEIVPNQSTNQNSPSFVLNPSNFTKSSISVENCIGNIQSSNSCISYVVLNNQNSEEPVSFDKTFSSTTASTNCIVSSTSSILDNLYSKENYVSKEDNRSPPLLSDDYPKDDIETRNDFKHEEIQPPPDRSSGGKYVCTYCNLVCSKPSVLQKHIRAHTNERPYPCISCGFSFKTRSNLYKHCRSRTHANRVMGNKAQEGNIESETSRSTNLQETPGKEEKVSTQDYRNAKPYKPRFHTAKQFYDNLAKENIEDERQNNVHASSDLLSHHINEIISKNNSIVNSSDPNLMKKRFNDDSVNNNEYIHRYNNRNESVFISTVEQKLSSDEPLNLTNKNRKRSMSEVTEPIVQKSLIKELLLKNLYSDMQCPYCKMIFQTVTELELHKLRSCKGKPSEAKYTRSSSVNVASILTKNKNAFDDIPQLQNTIFPLKSPGPFLGKTRLVESDKSKSFSFDNCNLPLASPNEISPHNYLLSPLPFDKEKKMPVKMFGGEVKIHSAGETKSFRISDNKEDKYETDSNFIEYGGKLSENRVVKSSLQSGGTVLTNKTNFGKQDMRAPQDVIRVYENTSVSPSIDITNLNKSKFNFDDKTNNPEIVIGQESFISKNINISSPSYKYTNIMDFSQKAVKLLTPNLKQPTYPLSATGATKFVFNNIETKSDSIPDNLKSKPDDVPQNLSVITETEKQNLNLGKKLFLQRTIEVPPVNNLYNPVNILVNGKVIRYVPGMPGPVAAEEPVEMVYSSNIIGIRPTAREQPMLSPLVIDKIEKPESPRTIKTFTQKEYLVPERRKSPKLDSLEIKTDLPPPKVNEAKSPVKNNDSKLPLKERKSPNNVVTSEIKKFVRPNSLALKPTTASLKQHHGLTPTIFNQILISPDTPRVAKKYAQHFLHGNYFSYLGLKSSTKPVYCTLNKTQPFYVPHFKKLSMYSEWRQQDTKADKLYVSAYDSRQRGPCYTMAGKTVADLIVHSSYKFVVSGVLSSKTEKAEDQQKSNVILGGYECNDDYTYIRGRGRGRYVCDQCGIRCKKPSMLKKHIRTHSNDRPYTCSHCNFSFKTKGNLTKHMKSKAHTKNYAASSGSGSSTQLSGTQSSESDTDDSGMDSSDESSTRQQEHEAAYGLLSLSQKTTQSSTHSTTPDIITTSIRRTGSPVTSGDIFMTTEEIAYVSKTNYAKNKILDERNSLSFTSTNRFNELTTVMTVSEEQLRETQNVINYLGKSSVNRPLTYPYTSILCDEKDKLSDFEMQENNKNINSLEKSEPKCIKQFHVIQKYAVPQSTQPPSPPRISEPKELTKKNLEAYDQTANYRKNVNFPLNRVPTLKVNDVVLQDNQIERKRKFPVIENCYKNKLQKNDEVMDLSMTTAAEKNNVRLNGLIASEDNANRQQENTSPKKLITEVYSQIQKVTKSPQRFDVNEDSYNKVDEMNYKNNEYNKELMKNNGTVLLLAPLQQEDPGSLNEQPKSVEYDNSAMETLADIATKQVKLEKNTLAKSVASEFLKLATKNENFDGNRDSNSFVPINKEVNDLIVKPEGNKSCTICSKSFSKPSQLRLHMNIHYLERPFRCDSCSVSFRTKGHLQKHERSASHHSKLSSSPAQSSSEPRPFKCSDCNIAFRIHGHLAKHLRSKMHIMKLECLAKIPFGLYAELERSNSLLTEINTSDGDQCLESLKTLAKKVFINDPNKLQPIISHVDLRQNADADS